MKTHEIKTCIDCPFWEVKAGADEYNGTNEGICLRDFHVVMPFNPPPETCDIRRNDGILYQVRKRD